MTEPEKSWASMWEYFDVKTSEPYSEVLAGRRMPGAEWITGAELNYAEHVLRNTSPESPAIMHRSEARLRDSVAARRPSGSSCTDLRIVDLETAARREPTP